MSEASIANISFIFIFSLFQVCSYHNALSLIYLCSHELTLVNSYVNIKHMRIHFICRGNVLRSLIAETYLRSLQLPNITTTSSGTNVNLLDTKERQFFANTILLFKAHGIETYAKSTSHQLTQKRVDEQDLTVCMNQRVIDEARLLVRLLENTQNWGIVDIGEGHRTVIENTQQYEEEIYQEITKRVHNLVSQLSL